MALADHLATKEAFVLGLDNILYPEKDYLLQVYYLFAEFMAYSEQLDSKKIIAFMHDEYAQHGSGALFQKTAAKFRIPLKYEENFALLHQNAVLPLKLLLYQQALKFLQELLVERKKIFLLVDGDPIQQLNKVKQIEWHGLEPYLKLYFSAEFNEKPAKESLIFILENNDLRKNQVLLVGNSYIDETLAANVGVDYASVLQAF
jgi:FMN phosphatase YigB (HAD superfamily)